MRYGSVCSGIESATVAWEPLGWTPQWFSEVEPFACRLLNHHYPSVPNLGDMLKIRFNETFQKSDIDLLVGGTPCQSFSIAGLRGGLADSNGNLALEFCRILAAKRPRWFVWENVPGVFSSFTDEEAYFADTESTEASDFATILQGFQECGYSISWRVLDAQFFGVPQRRRRVFVVGYLGDDWRPSAAVLFEPQGLRGNPKKGRKERETVAGTVDASASRSRGAGINPGQIVGTLDARTKGGGFPGTDGALNGHIVPALTSRPYADNESQEDKLIVHPLTGTGFDASEDGTGRGTPLVPWIMATGQAGSEIDRNLARELNCDHEQPILFSIMPMNSGKDYKARQVEVSQPIMTEKGHIGNQGGDIVVSPPSVTPINTQVATRHEALGERTCFGIGEPGDPQFTLSKAHSHAVFMAGQGADAGSIAYSEDIVPTLRSGKSGTNQTPSALVATSVRRLTPLECERLQGFPDGYTAIKGAADSPRYSGIGNSMCTKVMRWLGQRIEQVDKQFKC